MSDQQPSFVDTIMSDEDLAVLTPEALSRVCTAAEIMGRHITISPPTVVGAVYVEVPYQSVGIEYDVEIVVQSNSIGRRLNVMPVTLKLRIIAISEHLTRYDITTDSDEVERLRQIEYWAKWVVGGVE